MEVAKKRNCNSPIFKKNVENWRKVTNIKTTLSKLKAAAAKAEAAKAAKKVSGGVRR